jgi:anion-transporting  ArsA/GET3 family ATPase
VTSRPPEARNPSLDRLLASKEIAVTCGPGGVGKTTIAAAAAAMAACHHGGRVLVLTIDPARRLANALGLKGIGNTEHRIPAEMFTDAGVTPRGELWAAMLDTRASWDALIERHAPDRRTKEQILANPLYQNLAGRFVQSHDYIAAERLFEIHATGNYDLIVVDTPPNRHALDFLDAPKRMAEFFSSRLLRWLIVPYRSRLVNLASRPFYQVADRILGTQFLADIAEFFILFQSMHEGFVERADSVVRLLADRRTTFIVVSTLESSPLEEAELFADELVRRRLNLGAVVLNRTLPEYLRDNRAQVVAQALGERADQIAERLPTDPAITAPLLREVAESFFNFSLVARREAEQRDELTSSPDVVTSAPVFADDISNLAGLLTIGETIWG